MFDSALLRIGEVSKRVGVSPEVLRAWERRYGLLQPTRSPGGLRLYSSADVDGVRLMRRHIDAGLAPAEAAALATGGVVPADAERSKLATVGAAAARGARPLRRASGARGVRPAGGDRDGRHAAVRRRASLPAGARRPLRARRGVGRPGAFRIRAAARPPARDGTRLGPRPGPLAVLACLPGEQHELGLISFGLALH